MYYYRRGATNMVNGRRVRGAGELALSAALDPGRVRSGALGIIRQRFPSRRAPHPAGDGV
jgi:hypothetical protein